MRLCGLRSKPGYTTKPAVLFLSALNPSTPVPNSELQEAAGNLAAHRGLKSRTGHKFQCGGYFRSWTTMI